VNAYGTIILAGMMLPHGLSLAADLFNLKQLRGGIPDEMRALYDPLHYRKSQDYTRAATRFGIFSESVMLAATLVFWFSGGFNILDQLVRSWSLNFLFSGLSYFGLLFALRGFLSLPFSLYHTFVIEARFGFNKTTMGLFFTDLIRGVFLSIFLGGPVLGGVIAFFEYSGPFTWLFAWGSCSLFLVLMHVIAPRWILPLFNRFKPLEAGELRDKIMALAQTVNFPLQNVFVMDGSKRSTKSNAFFVGFGKNKRIVLYDTLIEGQSVPELLSVLAHEMGHDKQGHTLQGLGLGILQVGLMFFMLSVLIRDRGLYEAFFLLEPSVHTGLVFFSMLYSPLEWLFSLLMKWLSRGNEYTADRFSVEALGQPEALINALKKLAKGNLSNLSPHPLYTLLNDTHPPLLDRIAAIRAFSKLQALPGAA